MPLQSISANMVVSWMQARSNGLFKPTTQGRDGIEYNLTDRNPAFDFCFADSFEVPVGDAGIIDLKSMVDLVYTHFGFDSVLLVFVLPTGGGITLSPGVDDGFQLLGGSGRAVDIAENGAYFGGGDPAGTGKPVTSSNRTLQFTNHGPAAVTVDVVIVGAGTEIVDDNPTEVEITGA